MTEETKQEYKNFKYLGKKKAGEGIIGKGKKNEGKTWTRWKLIFENGAFEKEIAVFTPMGGKSMQIEDMKEDTIYNIGWKPGVQGERAATGFYIGKEKEGEVVGTSTPTTSGWKPEMQKFDGFKENYLAAIKALKVPLSAECIAVHMLGSFIATTEKTRIEELLVECEKAIK